MTVGRVLVVEADPTLRDLLQELLADEGLEVVPCASVREVLAKATGASGELALVDVWHKGETTVQGDDGEYLKRLGQLVPLVLITDHAGAQAATPDGSGPVAVLPKPFDVDALLAALRPVVSATSPSRALETA